MKKQTLAIVIAFLTISTISNAQKWLLTRYEAHFGLGTTNVFGDIGGAADRNNLFGLKDIKFKDTGPSFYLGFRYKTFENQAIKLNLILGTAKSSDLKSVNEFRNYSYKTMIFEPSLQYEYYFITETRRYGTAKLYNRRGMINNYSLMAFYAFGGVGGLYYSPKFSQGTSTHIFNPAKEFTGNSNTFTAVFPIGLGAKFSYNKFWSFGFEMGRRFVLSDYIDGLSTIYSNSKDTYYFSSFHVIYKLETDRYGTPLILKRRRPRF